MLVLRTLVKLTGETPTGGMSSRLDETYIRTDVSVRHVGVCGKLNYIKRRTVLTAGFLPLTSALGVFLSLALPAVSCDEIVPC